VVLRWRGQTATALQFVTLVELFQGMRLKLPPAVFSLSGGQPT
jgi:hypothetical protein